MKTLLLIDQSFEATWPFAGDHMAKLLATQGEADVVRSDSVPAVAASKLTTTPGDYTRLVNFGSPFTAECAAAFSNLREAVFPHGVPTDVKAWLAPRNVVFVSLPNQGYWGQSVAEFGLALTLCGLRRIPQTHAGVAASHDTWDYEPPGGIGRSGARGHQFGDDPRFTNGTIAGKRVRVVGAGNIAARYAQWAHMLGADVAAWDPFAPDPSFHRTGARREYHLDRLGLDAEIFAPMVPLTEKTRGLVTAAMIDALPKGCLVVLITRAQVCDFDAVRRRVLADELALAADVFDIEPLPLDDPLVGRHNVVHTPHNAGRTIQSNEQLAEALYAQLAPDDR